MSSILANVMTVLLCAVVYGAGARWMARRTDIPWLTLLGLALIGAGLGAVAILVERHVFMWAAVTQNPAVSGRGGALVATLVFAAPLEQALQLVPVWPLYTSGRIASARRGMVLAVCAACGFALTESLLRFLVPAHETGAGALAAVPSHFFSAAMWGYWLGRGRERRGRFFAVAWTVSVFLHGTYDFLAYSGGWARWLTAGPLLGGAFSVWWLLRDEVVSRDSAPASMRSSIFSKLPEPPSLRAMRRSLRRTDRPVMLHWIGFGALVTLGVMIVFLVGAVLIGNRVGVDFALADESGPTSAGPVLLLGAAVLSSFPTAGFLIARASSATSVLEPALAAGVAILTVVLMVTVASPVAILFALAVAPVAFGLACGGAWFGMER